MLESRAGLDQTGPSVEMGFHPDWAGEPVEYQDTRYKYGPQELGDPGQVTQPLGTSGFTWGK